MYIGRYPVFGTVFLAGYCCIIFANLCIFILTVLNFDLLQKNIIFVINLTNSIDIPLKLCYNEIVINLTIILTLLKLWKEI